MEEEEEEDAFICGIIFSHFFCTSRRLSHVRQVTLLLFCKSLQSFFQLVYLDMEKKF